MLSQMLIYTFMKYNMNMTVKNTLKKKLSCIFLNVC